MYVSVSNILRSRPLTRSHLETDFSIRILHARFSLDRCNVSSLAIFQDETVARPARIIGRFERVNVPAVNRGTSVVLAYANRICRNLESIER